MTVLLGAGPLTALLEDPEVTDVLVNGVQVWVDRGAGPVRAPVTFASAEETRRLAQRLATAGGRRLDDSAPYVDTQLADGSRLHAVLPPVAVSGPYLSVRTFRLRSRPLTDLVPPHLAELLSCVTAARLSVLISGGTGSGKTTLLNSLLALISPRERIVIVEDAAELRPDHPHVVSLQTRASNVEGVGEVRLASLVRQALRMRPDRLIVGECRGAETVELLGALNTGHDGGASTIHANTTADVPVRLETLGLLSGIPVAALRSQIAAAFQMVVHLRRTQAGRRLEEVAMLRRSGPGGIVTTWPVWHHQAGLGPAVATFVRLLTERGIPAPAWIRS